MCGICGVVSLVGDLDPRLADAVNDMATSLRHRGPDGSGFYRDAAAALGHRRLAIIDRAGGHQPMSNEDGTVWVVFNGEVYNHRWLKQILTARGHLFRSDSDTEAIVHAFEEFGSACVERLEGMFAFAVWDSVGRRLLLARDRIGKKPLFMTVRQGVLHFASEIKGLAASPLWDDELNTAQLETYLSLGYCVAPDSLYRHVSQLEPGSCVLVQNGELSTRRYWDVPAFDAETGDDEELLGRLEETIRAAVHDRLESEVPLGAFLSGGIDSGLVVSFMSERVRPVATTTVGFAEEAHSELAAAALTASYFESLHTPHVVSPVLDEVLDPIVKAFDEPFADPSAIPTYYVSQAARRHVIVALSGDGGDETFGGYDFRYGPHARDAFLRRMIPGRLGRRLLGAAGAAWPRSPHVPRPLAVGNLLENVANDEAVAYYSDLCFVKPREARALLGLPFDYRSPDSPALAGVTAWYRACPSADPVQRAEYADLKVYLPNGPLTKVDRLSMAHSLEVRCPLLDHHVVELAFRIPARRKIAGRQSKSLLRSIAARRLPRGLSDLPKHGFTAPVGEWIRGPHRERFRDEVLSRRAHVTTLIDRALLAQFAEQHMTRACDRSYVLWAIWVLERWLATRKAGRAEPATNPDSVVLSRDQERTGLIRGGLA
jgi:asparagine synthase (glutamine-hydrolysing)